MLVAFPPFILGSEDHTLDAGRMMQEHITDGLGALNDEGAFSVSSPLISEELSNARRLRARQQGGRCGQSSRLRLPALPAGRCFRRTNPLCPRFRTLEKGQLAAGTIVLML